MEATDANRHGHRTVIALLAGLVLLDAVFVGHFGLRMHGLAIYDEKFSVEGARWLHGSLQRLTETPGYGDRGIERLTAVLFVPAIWVFGSTAHQFVFDHVLMSLLFALQAVPVFLIARGLGARLWWALFAAAFAVFGPWAVFGTVFLNNTPAACASAFALWAMWRATVTPAPWWDALAVLLVVLAALARVSNAALAIAFPLAVLSHAFVAGRGRRSLRASAVDVVRRHWLLIALAALGAVVVAAEGSRRFLGHYADTSVGFHTNIIGNRALTTVAHLSAGTGVIAVAIGVAWVVRQVVRPLSPEAHAFAVLALVWFAALLWVNMASGIDERYELPLFVPLAIAFAVALARAEVAAVPTVLAGLICWLALHRHGDLGFSQASDYLTWPSREWLSRVWLNKAQYDLHLDRGTALDMIGIAATVVVGAVALVRGRWAPRLSVAAAAFAFVFAIAGSGWAMQKLSGAERPGASFSGVSFIDEVTGGKRTDPVGSTVETDSAVPQGWSEVQYFNSVVQHPISLEGKVYDLCCGAPGRDQVAAIDHATGAATSDTPLPEYVATIPEWLPAGFASKVVFASSAYSPVVRVEKLRQPPMAAWLSTGVDVHGWVRPNQPAALRVFPAGAGAPVCLRATLQAPKGAAPTRWQIAPDPKDRATIAIGAAGRIEAGASKRVEVHLTGTDPVDLRVKASPPGPDPIVGEQGLIGLSDLALVTCGTPEPQPRPKP